MGLAPRSSSALRILLVDGDSSARRVLKSALEDRIARPLMIMETAEPEAARAMVVERAFDAIAVDLDTIGGPAGFHDLAQKAGKTTTYALGPRSNVRDAVEAVRAGAADFIEKPLDGASFARRIERQFVGPDAAAHEAFEGMIGQSAAMRSLFEQMTRIAPSMAPVFVSGESGTGKGLVARAVHARSRRRTAPFVTVDCGGVDDHELFAELAGPGGAFDRAAGGTLHLDEVADLGDAVQGLLLRYLDTGEIGNHADRRTVSVRLVVSSNRRPDEIAASRRLRTDLFFRLNVLTLMVPPLRERSEDLPGLMDELLRRAAREIGGRPPRVTPSAERRLVQHDWRGNVRELKNLAERVVLSLDGDAIDADTVEAVLGPLGSRGPVPAAEDQDATARIRPLWVEEERLIEAAIQAFGGNIARAAAALEISPSTIYRKRRPQEGRAA